MDKPFLASYAALQIDYYLRREHEDFSAVEELTELVDHMMIRDKITMGDYDTLRSFEEALIRSSEGEMSRPVEEYELRMRLLHSELKDVRSLPDKRPGNSHHDKH